MMFGVPQRRVACQNLVTNTARLTAINAHSPSVGIAILQNESEDVAELLQLGGRQVPLGLVFLEARLAQPPAPAVILVFEVEIVYWLG